jgi:putative Holliday junction resolvase
MRCMALDLGSKTIGIAVSDVTGLIAGGVETIRRTSPLRDDNRLQELVQEYEVATLVVGYPKNMNGTVGERARGCEDFAEHLRALFPCLEVVLWDERLSTVAAEKVLVDADLRRKKRRKVIDMMAAVVILQNYLDSRQNLKRRTEAGS